VENQAVFNRLVQKDMNGICSYYREEGGEGLADRFFEATLRVVEKAAANPRYFHPLKDEPRLRRTPVEGFPYHFLYREIPSGSGTTECAANNSLFQLPKSARMR